MRMMLRARIPAERGSQALQDGTMPQTLQTMLERLRPEAVYFTPQEGQRSVTIVFDMDDVSQLPAISEPLFRMNATVDVAPAMTPEDLQRGLAQVEG